MGLTSQIIGFALQDKSTVPPTALAFAELSLLDWMTCGIAGANEPLAVKLRQMAVQEGGVPDASIIGGSSAPPRMAALVNGAISHALDFDDSHFGYVGHLSVGIYPAALALAEKCDASVDELVHAFLFGAEATIRVGMVLGREHYTNGFHQTATAGAFGATIAACRILGLDEGQIRNAIGLCATRASGLTGQFGSMGKPYNAGLSASNGVECATLASLGFTSADDGLMGAQGFVATHRPGGVDGNNAQHIGAFLIADNKYKLHACCHGLHAMIEGLLAVLDASEGADITLADISGFAIRTNPRWLNVCDIKRPRTGLEVKFSYNWLAGMTLRGDATGDDRLYSDALAGDQELANFAEKIEVTGDDNLTDLQIDGVLSRKDGKQIPVSFDLAAPLPEVTLAKKLAGKATTIIGDRGAEIWNLRANLGQFGARDIGACFDRLTKIGAS
jgi:2-methylcitrate dehydratase PrpD